MVYGDYLSSSSDTLKPFLHWIDSPSTTYDSEASHFNSSLKTALMVAIKRVKVLGVLLRRKVFHCKDQSRRPQNEAEMHRTACGVMMSERRFNPVTSPDVVKRVKKVLRRGTGARFGRRFFLNGRASL